MPAVPASNLPVIRVEIRWLEEIKQPHRRGIYITYLTYIIYMIYIYIFSFIYIVIYIYVYTYSMSLSHVERSLDNLLVQNIAI